MLGGVERADEIAYTWYWWNNQEAILVLTLSSGKAPESVYKVEMNVEKISERLWDDACRW